MYLVIVSPRLLASRRVLAGPVTMDQQAMQRMPLIRSAPDKAQCVTKAERIHRSATAP
jgi:hypothetical protein